MPEIAIVIRTFNVAAILGRTLEQVARQTERAEILVVDSGSTDETPEIVRGVEGIRWIEIPQHEFTFGRALNVGIARVGEGVRYVVLLSADAIPRDERWLSELVAPLRREPRVAGVYGQQIPRPEHLSNPVVRALSVTAYPACFAAESSVTASSPFFSNANSAVRKSCWQRQRFDEEIAGAEDWLWAKQQIEQGYLIAYQATAAVYHSHAESFSAYYRRRCNDIRGGKAVDPARYPKLGPVRCLVRLALLAVRFGLGRLHRPDALGRGTSWDRFRLEIVSILAQRATSRGDA